jgi:hypothetical protein
MGLYGPYGPYRPLRAFKGLYGCKGPVLGLFWALFGVLTGPGRLESGFWACPQRALKGYMAVKGLFWACFGPFWGFDGSRGAGERVLGLSQRGTYW